MARKETLVLSLTQKQERDTVSLHLGWDVVLVGDTGFTPLTRAVVTVKAPQLLCLGHKEISVRRLVNQVFLFCFNILESA